MDNHDILTHSGERLSFFQLINQKRLSIEVPIIQRDYAQGRDNQSALREAFLDALYEYLQQGKPNRDLDFIYGSIIESTGLGEQSDHDKTLGRFIPLDGQQRLTTLFLLHWYLAQISGKAQFLREVMSINDSSMFTYETRNSSREFCYALIANDINFNELLIDEQDNENLAETIKDRGWFYLSWTSDPTICSMLTMLNAIHRKFLGCTAFFDRLVDADEPVITFLFLNLQEFKLSDDLYIKMNARGKPLTHFENFKSRLEKKIKAFDQPWPNYKLHFHPESVSGYRYFIHKIDTDWADLFWCYRNQASRNNTYDDELMNLIALAIANFHMLNNELEIVFFGARGGLKRLTFTEYEVLNCLTQNLLVHLISLLDLLHHDYAAGAKQLVPYLEENRYYSEQETFIKVIENSSSYPEKLRFYAFYEALGKGLRGEDLTAWVRVVHNLTENMIFNTLDDYYRALKSLRDLVECETPILEQLQNGRDISAFPEAQVIEEKIKAYLIDKSTEWVSEIIELEAHTFFNGQIGFILKFSDIVKYYQDHGNTDWGENDSSYLERFRHYARSASAVFSCIAESSGEINYAWERAVLTKGEYLTATTGNSNRFNLLSTRRTDKNIDRDHSWKRLLRLPLKENDQWNERQSYVKAVFDDANFRATNVSGSLEIICSESTLKDWRKFLVQMPKLFSECRQGFIVKNDDEVVLLHQSQRNHYHSELYSKFLYYQLEEEGIDIKPFHELNYISEKSIENLTYISISDFNYQDCTYEVEVWYEANEYHMRFFEHEDTPFSKPIISVLTDTGFVKAAIDEFEHSYSHFSKTPKKARKKLKKLLANLRGLVDD